MKEMIAYIKLHILSLEQDMEKYYSGIGFAVGDIHSKAAALDTSRQLLSVAEDILSKNDGN